MQRPRVRLTLRTMMIVVAMAALAIVLTSSIWNRPPAVDSFDAMEMIGPDRLFADFIKVAWEIKDSHIELPTVPGLGIEVDEREAARMTRYVEELGGEHFYETDGSVADW